MFQHLACIMAIINEYTYYIIFLLGVNYKYRVYHGLNETSKLEVFSSNCSIILLFLFLFWRSATFKMCEMIHFIINLGAKQEINSAIIDTKFANVYFSNFEN